MQGLVIPFHNFSVPPTSSSLLDGSAPTNGDFTSSLGLEFFLRLATGSNNETNKVVLGMILNRNANLFGALAFEEAALFRGGVEIHELFQHVLSLGC
jgi:hypothetical protein